MHSLDELIPTRRSLLDHLKQWNDQESWKVFFDTYWKLIYGTALKAGLNDAEAQDVVQETVISVLKSMPSFEYEGRNGSFKSWLLQLTRWRISDQFKKRVPGVHNRSDRTSPCTATIERLADPAEDELVISWNREWETNLMEAAIERVKRKVKAEDYQVFDLYVFKQWPVSRVVRTLRVNPGKVYLIKHRIGNLIKKEVARLREKPF
jgi:RNA polymerase sigma-70 factor (ECF subfamily)